jgi:DNA (cytosine-5)-methyltransferase 1
MRRIIEAVRPTWVIGENVAGFVNMELDRSLSDLEAIGYACQAFVIPACAVDAKHRRDRVWIICNSNSNSKSVGTIDDEATRMSVVANSQCRGQQGSREYFDALSPKASSHWQDIKPVNGGEQCEWLTKPPVGRVANGIPRRMDRLRGLGNAVVPQVVAEIARAILTQTSAR